jgi:phosphoribosylanthranilate isomerase
LTQIKVCGLTRRFDVDLCLELNVDRLGFVLAPSPRQLGLAQLDSLLPPSGCCWSAVLVNPDRRLVEDLLDRGCPILQFHGHESPEFCAQFRGRALLVKALRISSPEQLLQDFPVDEYLFDGPRPGQGQPFPWNWLGVYRPNRPYFLAGGLQSQNVEQAIRQACPRGVDVSSGVEQQPGVKDAQKLRDFVTSVRDAGAAAR